MKVTVLRLGHRKERDKRISTHCGLVARAFGASEIIYAGEEDSTLVNSLDKVSEKWGGKFKARYTRSPLAEVKKFKKKGGVVVHATMYGENFWDVKIPKKPLMIIIGAEKVPREYYELADYNVAIGNQPHSEVAALSILLYYWLEGGLKKKIRGKISISPNARGKTIKKK
ncbi:tRNA (cytidine(56)-2'-O)-methyltransferase [Candidatus Micrarchaeota archaeon]|nr:tRNA (cytidine(56)-2'-O)-methyltransferase [Candidatus Micrarchaeota archaeon]